MGGGTIAKALAGGGCGHCWDFRDGSAIGYGKPGQPFNARQVYYKSQGHQRSGFGGAGGAATATATAAAGGGGGGGDADGGGGRGARRSVGGGGGDRPQRRRWPKKLWRF